MKWDKQREVLMNLGNEISDEDVISTLKDGQGLTELLKDHSISEQQEIIKSQMSKVKKDIDGLPARLDEANRAIADTSEFNQEELTKQQNAKQAELDNAQEALSLFKVDNSAGPTQEKIKLQGQLSDKRASFLTGIQLSQSGLTTDLNDQQRKVNDLTNEVSKLRTNNTDLGSSIKQWQETKKTLLDQYHAEENITFDEHQLTCPTCGQDLPQEKQEEIKAKFNQAKSEKIASIKETGQAAASKIDGFQNELDNNSDVLMTTNDQLEIENKKLSELKAEVETQKQSTPVFEESAEYLEITKKINKCDEDIANNVASNNESTTRALPTFETFKPELPELDAKLA